MEWGVEKLVDGAGRQAGRQQGRMDGRTLSTKLVVGRRPLNCVSWATERSSVCVYSGCLDPVEELSLARDDKNVFQRSDDGFWILLV
jgi:hypothetical protein